MRKLLSVAQLVMGMILTTALVAEAQHPDEQRKAGSGEKQLVRAHVPAELSVTVGPGQVTMANGRKVAVAETRLLFAPPETREVSVTGTTPRNYAAYFDDWDAWPNSQFDPGPIKIPNSLDLSPHHDEQGTLILGNLFRAFLPDSLVVTSKDGSKVFEKDKDYRYNANWAQVSNLDERLGKINESEITAKAKYALQRLDLVQVDASGKVSVKQGKSAMVCPVLPEADAGSVGVAGIYIAAWKAALNPYFDAEGGLKAKSDFAISQHEIFAIDPAPPVQPINKTAVSKSLKKLANGEELKIAFVGASITVGAEAPAWWADLWTEKNLSFASRVVCGLRKAYPKAIVTPIAASQGGTTAKYGLDVIENKVIAAKADLVLLDFGTNDANGPVGKGPNNPPEQFKEDMRALVKKSKNAGIEVIVVVGEAVNPWLKNKSFERWPAYRQAMLDVAKEENVAAADISTEVANLATHGIPPYSQLHNLGNHPGALGHKVYADVILRFFDAGK